MEKILKKTVKKSSQVPAFVNTLDCQKGDIGVNLPSTKLPLRRDSTFSVEKEKLRDQRNAEWEEIVKTRADDKALAKDVLKCLHSSPAQR